MPRFRFVRLIDRPSDSRHYASRFLSQPSRTDGTVEVAHLWRDHVMAEIALRRSDPMVAIGRSPECDIVLSDESITADRFALVSRETDGTPYLQLTLSMRGDVYIDGNRFSISDALGLVGPGGLRLTPRTRARLQFGESTLLVHQGTRPRLALPDGGIDGRLFSFFGLSAAFHTLLLLLIFLAPPAAKSLELDYFRHDEHPVGILQLEEEALPDTLPAILELATETGDDDGGENEVGSPSSQAMGPPTLGDSRFVGEERSHDDPGEAASDRGVVNVLGGYDLSNLFGEPVVSGPGPFLTAGGPSPNGLTGVAMRGFSASCAHAEVRERCLGRLVGGFDAGSPGPRRDVNLGRDLARLSEREREITVIPCCGPTLLEYPRESISRVIRENRRGIRSCYEDSLQRSPELAGRLVVHFVIDPTGHVATARVEESTMGDADVETCVVRRMRRLVFPEPRGQQLVRVNYPFLFVAPRQ